MRLRSQIRLMDGPARRAAVNVRAHSTRDRGCASISPLASVLRGGWPGVRGGGCMYCGLCNAFGAGGETCSKSAPKWDAFACFEPPALPQWEILENALQSRVLGAGAMQPISRQPDGKAASRVRPAGGKGAGRCNRCKSVSARRKFMLDKYLWTKRRLHRAYMPYGRAMHHRFRGWQTGQTLATGSWRAIGGLTTATPIMLSRVTRAAN